MKVIGLTGSLGMGKSTAVALLRRLGVRVHEADRIVHRLMAKGGAAVPAVAAAFPEAVRAGGVDRTRLGARVFADPALLARLESILHPMVRAESAAFLARARRSRVALAVLDVPLLFETGQDRDCDATVVVTAPAFVQRARALARPGMTANRLALVLAHQMPDGKKRRRADFVVPTGLGRRTTLRRLRRMLKEVRRGRVRGRRRAWSAPEGQMREIVLDTETTGLEPGAGHRVVEIACIELQNHLPTGAVRQWYLNPERDMPSEAFAVHGLDTDFLTRQPRFAAIADEFLAFIAGAPLVIHNAEFDIGFLNAELTRAGRSPLPPGIAIDTLDIARRTFPGAQASLDALCRRFAIDNSARTRHGALLDAELLAEVYLELIGGRQPGLQLVAAAEAQLEVRLRRDPRPARPHLPSAGELAAHALLLQRLSTPIWRQ